MRTLLLAGALVGLSLPAAAASVDQAIVAVAGAEREIYQLMSLGPGRVYVQVDPITYGNADAFDLMVSREWWRIQRVQAAAARSPAVVSALNDHGVALANVVGITVDAGVVRVITR